MYANEHFQLHMDSWTILTIGLDPLGFVLSYICKSEDEVQRHDALPF